MPVLQSTFCFFVVFFILKAFFCLGYEEYRLPKKYKFYKYDWYWLDFRALPPHINGYGGPQGLRTVVPCKVRSEIRPHIAWYRKVINSSACVNDNNILLTGNETFCRDHRVRLSVTRNWKYVMKLILRRPTIEDSGLYMCLASTPHLNFTQKALLTFHDRTVTPVRVCDAKYDNFGEGRVEFRQGRRWVSADSNSWETPEARLFCRLLGYPYGGEPRHPVVYGGLFFYSTFYLRSMTNMVTLDCPINATDVTDCSGWDNVPRRTSVAGVTCRRTPVPEPTKDIRFAGGSPTEGRVEVYYDGLWGTMCKRGLTENEVNAVCKLMGYRYGGFFYNAWNRYDRTESGVGPIMISGLQCPSTASSLQECTNNGLGMPCCNCTHDDDVAIRCFTRPDEDVPTRHVRLAGYNRDDKGRVEVYRNGTWAVVKAFWLHYPEAKMFCKMLGYQYGVPIFNEDESVPGGYAYSWIEYIGCPLNASTIAECQMKWTDSTEPRVIHESGAVLCWIAPVEAPNMPFRVWRRGDREKLQYYKDGYWGTVCGAYIGTPEAFAICSMMGHRFGGSLVKSWTDSTYRGFGPILLKYLDCPINATHTDQCPFREFTDSRLRSSSESCLNHQIDVNIDCRQQPLEDIPVRLHGASPNKGVVEIFYSGEWNLVATPADPRIIAVLCRQLGYRDGGQSYYAGYCGHPISCNLSRFLMGHSDCTGKEENIGHCNGLLWGDKNSVVFFPPTPLGIHCYEQNDREFEVTVTEEGVLTGKVMLRVGDETFSVCSKLWDEIHAKAVCKEMGFSDGLPKYYVGEYSVWQTDKFVLSMYCQRGVSSLRQCYHTGWYDWNPDCFDERPVRAGVQCIP